MRQQAPDARTPAQGGPSLHAAHVLLPQGLRHGSGDGAGFLTGMPDSFLKRCAKKFLQNKAKKSRGGKQGDEDDGGRRRCQPGRAGHRRSLYKYNKKLSDLSAHQRAPSTRAH